MFHNDMDNQFQGLRVAAASRIPSGTRVMCCHGKVVSKETMKKTHRCVCSHLCNVDGTGCAIDGPHHILFNGEALDLDQIHQTPAPLMSLTNSSWNQKDPNCCEIVDNRTSRECMDDMKLDATIWLETTRDIEIGEKLVWEYTVHQGKFKMEI